MPARPYVVDYQGTFALAASPDEVWAELSQVDSFAAWWGWLDDFRHHGDGLSAGTVLEGSVRPPLPYRLGLVVTFEECVRPSHIQARVRGDLEGPARLMLRADGHGTEAEVRWTLEMKQPAVRRAAVVAWPLLRWGHDRLVDATVRGFRRHLDAGGGGGDGGPVRPAGRRRRR